MCRRFFFACRRGAPAYFEKQTEAWQMKWIARIGILVLGVLALAVLLGGGLFVWDATLGPKATDYTNVTFSSADGATVHGYLAQPKEPGSYPAVIMIHEFWGLNQHIQTMADDLAARGYVVLAPDTYRGQTTGQIPRAIYLRVNTPQERVMADLQGAFDFLKTQPNVDARRIAVLGFCYGGEMALQHALRNAELAATVVFYGSPVTDPAQLGALLETKRPVLGIFAQDDQQIPPAEANAFQTALNAAGIPNTVTIYPNVGHAFVQPETIAAGGAAADAWRQTIEFLDANVKNKAAHGVERAQPVAYHAAPNFVVPARGALYWCTVAVSHLRLR
jgi:carboxymethylenebutenolidase